MSLALEVCVSNNDLFSEQACFHRSSRVALSSSRLASRSCGEEGGRREEEREGEEREREREEGGKERGKERMEGRGGVSVR